MRVGERCQSGPPSPPLLLFLVFLLLCLSYRHCWPFFSSFFFSLFALAVPSTLVSASAFVEGLSLDPPLLGWREGGRKRSGCLSEIDTHHICGRERGFFFGGVLTHLLRADRLHAAESPPSFLRTLCYRCLLPLFGPVWLGFPVPFRWASFLHVFLFMRSVFIPRRWFFSHSAYLPPVSSQFHNGPWVCVLASLDCSFLFTLI